MSFSCMLAYILQLPVVMSLVLQHLTSENCSPYLGNQPLQCYETNALPVILLNFHKKLHFNHIYVIYDKVSYENDDEH